MKACLVLPPIRDFYLSPARLSALGLRCLAEILDECGWDSVLFNFTGADSRSRTLPLPRELDHLKPWMIPGETGPLSWFSAFRHFGPDYKEAAELIRREAPDLILISVFAWAYAEEGAETARTVKRILPEVPVVLGGAGCTVLPEYFARKDTADYLFTGEAEPGFRQFLKALEEGNLAEEAGSIPNLMLPGGSRPDRVLSRVEDLRPLAAENPGSGRKDRSFSVSFSRGCPRGCRFCSNGLTHGRRFRSLPAEQVLAGLIGRLPEAGLLHINFEDDNLLLEKDSFLELLKGLRSRYPDLRFSAENGLDYSLMTPELLQTLAGLGLTQLNLSLGAPEPETALRENRFLELEKYDRLVHAADKMKIPVISYFICGLEGDSPEGTVDTLLLLASRPTTAGISLFYPVPGLKGIPGFSRPEDFLTTAPRLCAGTSAVPWTGALSTAQMLTAFRLARAVNLLRKKEAGVLEQELLSRCLETGKLHTLVRRGGQKQILPVPGMDDRMSERFFSALPRLRS